MLSTKYEYVCNDVDFGWSVIHFSQESRLDGLYRCELVDALAVWRSAHADRIIRKFEFLGSSNSPEGINVFWDERIEQVVGPHPVIGLSDPPSAKCFDRNVVYDWLVVAREFAQDFDVSPASRDVIVSRSGIAATFSLSKSVILTFPLMKLVHYLGLKKMVDLRDYLFLEFEDQDTPYVQLKFPSQARF